MAATTVSIDLAFRDNDHLRAEYHSFANLINVVHTELQLLDRMSEGDSGLRPAIRLCEASTWSFKDREEAIDHAAGLGRFKRRIVTAVDRVQPLPEYTNDAGDARDILMDVVDDADLRIQEMLARHQIAPEIENLTASDITSRLLAGAEKNWSGTETTLPVVATDVTGLPIGLPDAVGQLAGMLYAHGCPVSVSVRHGEDTSVKMALNSNPTEINLMPLTPPRYDSTAAGNALRILVAKCKYVAGPASTLLVNPNGDPLGRDHSSSEPIRPDDLTAR